jgi:hypothetical protein
VGATAPAPQPIVRHDRPIIVRIHAGPGLDLLPRTAEVSR